ncbi:MAG: 4'-phosphopantetheinyl transferase superfamily protein, partial [Thermodesulfobacteriota bacterium]|nr:4'-phosphopantetheinyl transferase superfamily protein [Thermodesulfobacteriota bacterium]
DDIVQQFFHPQEIRAYQALSQSDRAERFYTHWTLKEAYLKAVGRGLDFPLNSFWFLLSDSDGATHIDIHFEDQKRDGENQDFQFFLGRPTAEHLLAVAISGQENLQFVEHQYCLTQDGSMVPHEPLHPS